jgi:tRNA A-37 threonylcarbamoyl transferase component Bud32
MAWVEILPGFEFLFRQIGWASAAPFLAWTGILVNKHRNRQVEQVLLPSPHRGREGGNDVGFYVKKEFAVSWHNRFRNAWHGFGWCSTAVREGAILQALREAGIGCPEVVALGEDRRQAFVLLRDHSDMIELRTFLQQAPAAERNRLAVALGRELARMHDAGFDHPDLFAKHILVASAEARFCILDWQRARRRRTVSWRLRCRDLAVLDATLHDGLASDWLRLRCLHAYVLATGDRRPLGRVAGPIRREAERLRKNRNIREIGQMPVPAADLQFVPASAGRLLIVRSYFEQLDRRVPDWLARLGDSEPEDLPQVLACASESGNWLVQSWPSSKASWDIPPLAHTLFRLARFGVPAPRLLVVGYAETYAFVLAKSAATIPFEEAFAKASFVVRARMLQQAGSVVRQLHDAGYYLPAGDSWRRRLGVVRGTGAIFLAKVDPLPRDGAPWHERGPTELNGQKIGLSRTEQLRFLHGYLRRRNWKKDRERQAIS